MKPKDEAALVEYLEAKEAAIEKLKADEEAAALAAAAGAGGSKGKADPKKDPKAAAKGGPKGGVPVTDDKNVPQAITVEYPQIESEKNYIIYER